MSSKAQPTHQASAPPEAEVYQATDALLLNVDDDNIPVANAVPIQEETIARYSDNLPQPQSVHYDEPIHHNSSLPQEENVYFSDLGLERHRISCPFCHRQGVTNIHHIVDTFTVAAALLLFLLFWPICWLPFCLSGCKITEHYCPHCHRRVGIVRPCERGCGCCGC